MIERYAHGRRLALGAPRAALPDGAIGGAVHRRVSLVPHAFEPHALDGVRHSRNTGNALCGTCPRSVECGVTMQRTPRPSSARISRHLRIISPRCLGVGTYDNEGQDGGVGGAGGERFQSSRAHTPGVHGRGDDSLVRRADSHPQEIARQHLVASRAQVQRDDAERRVEPPEKIPARADVHQERSVAVRAAPFRGHERAALNRRVSSNDSRSAASSASGIRAPRSRQCAVRADLVAASAAPPSKRNARISA